MMVRERSNRHIRNQASLNSTTQLSRAVIPQDGNITWASRLRRQPDADCSRILSEAEAVFWGVRRAGAVALSGCVSGECIRQSAGVICPSRAVSSSICALNF